MSKCRFFTRWDRLPSFYEEFLYSIAMYEYYCAHRPEYKEKDLLLDIWDIVFSFLDYTQPMELSLPLEEFTVQTEIAYAIPRTPRTDYLTHICGREDGHTFRIQTSLTTYTFNGHPLISLNDFFFSGLQILHDNPKTRYVVQVSFGDAERPLSCPKYWIQEADNVREIPFEQIERCGVRPVYEICGGYDRVVLF